MAEFDTLTGLGDIPGTLAYISPERLHGETATPAADVWAVGVLLWEALAGEHPFWGGDLTETSRRIQQGAPPLETLRPDLPRHVLDTVASALVASPQRRPDGRFASRRSCARCRSARRQKKAPSRRGSRATKRAAPERAAAARRALTGLAAGWVVGDAAVLSAELARRLSPSSGRRRRRRAARGSACSRSTVAFFPLANISLGLAARLRRARGRLVELNWRDARAGLLLGAGPLLAPLAALDAHPARRAARARARAPRAARCDSDPAGGGGRGPAARTASFRRLGHRRSGSGSPAPTARAPSHTHSQPSSAPIRRSSPRP